MKASTLRILRISLFAFAAVMIIAGIFQGEAVQVFNKAVKICLECIGIG